MSLHERARNSSGAIRVQFEIRRLEFGRDLDLIVKYRLTMK